MLPLTARPNDIVEVIDKKSDYYGALGKLVSNPKNLDKDVTVNIYGKEVSLPRSHLAIKARKGTKTYSELNEVLEARETRHLTAEDYDELINHALDVKEYDWAHELAIKKQALKKKSRA